LCTVDLFLNVCTSRRVEAYVERRDKAPYLAKQLFGTYGSPPLRCTGVYGPGLSHIHQAAEKVYSRKTRFPAYPFIGSSESIKDPGLN
jgi:hypothetical protein